MNLFLGVLFFRLLEILIIIILFRMLTLNSFSVFSLKRYRDKIVSLQPKNILFELYKLKKNLSLNMECEISDVVSDIVIPLVFKEETSLENDNMRVLSLFSGCGGMDLGFEGGFICHKKSVNPHLDWISEPVNDNWVRLKRTKFRTVFANDILKDARTAWVGYMRRFGYSDSIYHLDSIINLVKLHQAKCNIFPENIDIVTGGFPCQDFSVSGKRKGFDSDRSHDGTIRTSDVPSEETRGKLYFWMKRVIDITKPKMFIAENVKGLVNLGNVMDIIRMDFSQADDDGYIVFDPQILNAGDYGVPETRERVIFIGVRKNALKDSVRKLFESGNIPEKYNPYPIPTHGFTKKEAELLPPVVCQDIFEGLKEPEDSIDLSQKFYSRAKYMGEHCQGQKEISIKSLAPTIRSEHHGNIEYRRLSREHGGVIFDELDRGMVERRLTPRECALIQTFPPDYPFVSRLPYSRKLALSPSGAYRVIGNAVPPVLAYNIANRLQNLWNLYFK
jgi:DNA (cytosine-5-)-methyltransferase